MRKHLLSLVLVNTSHLMDKALNSKEINHKYENNLSLVEFPIEFKTTVDQDPFIVVNPVPPSDTNLMTK